MRQVGEGRESNLVGVGEVGRGRENVGSLHGEMADFSDYLLEVLRIDFTAVYW